ncbi:MAG: hypothetical protein D3920_14850 [Candidatus Electrothrix sp. AW2]|jgi:hypothetical protein|nr:hypothetical protein [Candidatus Electrothrix gigas]MCI5136307.1 hypothetical protein [Candidatus Electrothrix gigas]
MDSDNGGFLPIKQADLDEQLTKATAFLRRASWHPKVKATPPFFSGRISPCNTLLFIIAFNRTDS